MEVIGLQDKRIQKCIGGLFCNIVQKEAIGKDIDAEETLMKKLFLMVSISPYVGYSGEFDCFLNANCGC